MYAFSQKQTMVKNDYLLKTFLRKQKKKKN